MKLVLLPGMDGTGELFSPLLQALPELSCEVIALPTTGAQDYPVITTFVREQLPEEDFILFSGPVGDALAQEGMSNLKGIVFVATFLSPPNKLLLAIAQLLPLKHLSGLPFSKHVLKALFLGSSAPDELTNLFQHTIRSLPSTLIRARLKTMFSLTYKPKSISIPARYIRAASDKLVSPEKAAEFSNSFGNLVIKTIAGPHFILQANPAECAAVISEFVACFHCHCHNPVPSNTGYTAKCPDHRTHPALPTTTHHHDQKHQNRIQPPAHQ